MLNMGGKQAQAHLGFVATSDTIPPLRRCFRAALEDNEHLVLVLIDGLGWWNLQDFAAYAPNLRRLLSFGKVGELSAYTVCPSTTAAAITSLLTGVGPGATNMLSYQLYDPALSKRFDLISFRDYPHNPEDFQNQETFFERFRKAGVETFALGPKKFIGGGLTRAALRGAQYVSSEKLDLRAQQAAKHSRTGRLTYFYVAEVDHAGHGHGVGSEAWVASLEETDRAIGVLLENLPAQAGVFITADHGMINTSTENTFDLATSAIASDIKMASGEGRVMHLRLEDSKLENAKLEDARARLGEELAQLSPFTRILTRSQCAKLIRDFGSDTVRRPELLGDLVVYSGGNAQVLDRRFFRPETFLMTGVHGGLSETEMRVPVLQYRA